MITIITGISTCVLAVALCIQSIMHYKERKDLYNRLMARDYAEYTASLDNNTQKHYKSAHKAVLDRWRGVNKP